MGKYKQWLHHQEIGRRLRDQINTLEQERARVQQMAPAHPTSLPDTSNPVIAALLNYTQQGHTLSDIDVIKAAMPDIGIEPDPDQRQPATSAPASTATPTVESITAVPVVSTSSADDAVVASLLARAQQMPGDPLEQMQTMTRAGDSTSPSAASSGAGTAPTGADSVNGWWQRQRADEQD